MIKRKIQARIGDLALVKIAHQHGYIEKICLIIGSFVATDGVCDLTNQEYTGKQHRYLEYITWEQHGNNVVISEHYDYRHMFTRVKLKKQIAKNTTLNLTQFTKEDVEPANKE